MYPLTRCQARTPSFLLGHMGIDNITRKIEDTEKTSRPVLQVIGSIVIDNSISDRGISNNRDTEEEEEEDVKVEELGSLASRTVDNIDLIRRDSEKIWTASAKSRMNGKHKVRDWFVEYTPCWRKYFRWSQTVGLERG
ncbi:hypothetical protein IG631_03647 [Alternaria alternata]|nr:hypothetical protein IG631_03647 [Alternaria alternata]